MPSSIKCAFQAQDGATCKRWANRGSRFCNNHQPSFPLDREQYRRVHPLARLATPDDVFNVIRESLNATRQGRMSPGQAYAVGYLANLWLKFYPRVESAFRQDALFQQILPTLVDADAAAAAEREQDEMPPPVQSSVPVAVHHPVPPFPVEIDEYASTAAPPPPRSAAEAKAQFDARLAATPTPLYPDPVTGRLLTPNELLETDPAFIAMRQRELAGATSLPGAQVAQAFQPVLPPEVAAMQKRSTADVPPSPSPSPSSASSSSPSENSPLTPPGHSASDDPRPISHPNASESPLPASEISDLRSVISALSRSSKRQRNGQPSALHKTIIETVLKQIFAGSNRDP